MNQNVTMPGQFALTLSCPDQIGIVHAVSGFLAEHDGNIRDSQQFSDEPSGRFFMRVHFESSAASELLSGGFAVVAGRYAMDWQLNDLAARPKVLVLASKPGHCLNDLLYRFRIGALRGELTGVVSNHPDWGELVRSHGVGFHCLPVAPDSRAEQEQQLLQLVAEQQADVVVLARYMQVLSDQLCAKLAGKAINIHHSFLPSFKGARPYRQAHARGVKLIGATAHFVTADLDEGPIIEQETARVDHAMSPEQLAAAGRDLECTVLARALSWHLEHRVLLNGARTVVFR